MITQGSLVRDQPDPPSALGRWPGTMTMAIPGGLAQLGEHLLCKQGVVGSIPSSSTNQQTRQARSAQQQKTQVHTPNTKAALQKAALMLVHIDGPIGCSLKIYRVKSALLVETAQTHKVCCRPCHRQREIFDCVKTNIQTLSGNSKLTMKT